MPACKCPAPCEIHPSILRLFLSEECPACHRVKRPRMAFCSKCYFSLPGRLKNKLWSYFGEGFEGAFEASLKWLAGERTEEGEQNRGINSAAND